MKLLLCALFTVSAVITGDLSKSALAETPKIDGVYIFVSETTTTTKPTSETYDRKTPEWKGICIFHAGAYSWNLLNRTVNDKWLTEDSPISHPGLGYESRSGTYEIDRSTLTVRADIAMHAFDYKRPDVYEYKVDGDELILKKKLVPHVEDLRAGEVVTILQKVPASKLNDL